MLRLPLTGSRTLLSLAVLACVALASGRAVAFEALDGRVQLHGFAEMQVRGISADFSDNLDLTQWYNILNLELEVDLIEDTIGPIDSMGLYVRGEVRYDCVWTRGCGMFPSANVYGNRAKKLPHRLSNAKEVTTNGAILLGNERSLSPSRAPVPLSGVQGFNTSFAESPVAFAYTYANYLDFRFTQTQSISGVNFDHGVDILGPWLPKNFVYGNAGLADRVNPFDAASASPQVAALGRTGSGARPFRPIPTAAPGALNAKGPPARGMYIASQPLRRLIAEDAFDDIGKNFNFTQAERSWNRGLSQQQTKELKEAYVEIETFEARLWMRLGLQNIVWGKTELFRTTDQFNAQDLALSSLPNLEESRIPEFAGRFIYSFYETAIPVDDLRIEFAFNFDHYQSNDLGSCGEAYTIDLVCQGQLGVWAHSVTAVGLAGADIPPNPWDDLSGIEVGGRIEWRLDRFSFALMDFWGYDDLPTVERITTYERNVDPQTGVPRIYGARGSCTTTLIPGTNTNVNPPGDPNLGQPTQRYVKVGNDCLQPGPQYRQGASLAPTGVVQTEASLDTFTGDKILNGPNLVGSAGNALEWHHANQQIFAFVCSQTVGVDPTGTDPAACAQTIFGSAQEPATGIKFAQIISGILAGNQGAQILLLQRTFDSLGNPLGGIPIVQINNDDGGVPGSAREVVANAALGSPEQVGVNSGFIGTGLSGDLTPEQEALLGCGPWWGTNCDDQGIDLLNADASVLLQSWPGFEGTGPDPNYQIPYAGPFGTPPVPVGPPQPGHVGFVGGPVCTTGNLRSDGRNDRLPGCRNVGAAGYQVNVDGGVANIGYVTLPPLSAETIFFNTQVPFQGLGSQNPLHGQTFANELAAVSWNFLMLLAAQGRGFTNAGAFTPGQCSYVSPQFCHSVQGIIRLAGVTRNTPRAGGNYSFGRRTFAWHSGGEVLVTATKRNVLGFSMDFAEDRTKSNWSMEFTWINKQSFFDFEAVDNVSFSDVLNLTVSVDRPTFVNFLNANRTIFFNSQWFFRYVPGHKQGYSSNQFDTLFTVSATTGYFQDRLLPTLTGVMDIRSASGALLTQLTYRYSEAFSMTLGLSLYMGEQDLTTMDVNPIGATSNETGKNAYQRATQPGLTVLRNRDELFLSLRYTF